MPAVYSAWWGLEMGHVVGGRDWGGIGEGRECVCVCVCGGGGGLSGFPVVIFSQVNATS